MVKVFVKGGVWKNSEDEILKAAVMKYGKQNWARVASLLNRKSAKQAKARWHEWLDPSVRKVEWSRPEEEKLLHLAKLLPAQWKTIGPLVGRTAAQCQEHYEQLLDSAAAAAAGQPHDTTHALRSTTKLQPGQIDAAPETKPARPDPVDMDEDEIEMLQEARARLANTLGKKAKRKARDKLLAQAKRLADLQKRRELKQAGLLSAAAKTKTRNKREIDLGVEIPFHKPAPAGFHDTTQESGASEQLRQKRLKSVDFKELNENQYRTRDREALQAKKREEARLQNLERSNMQYAVAAVSKTADPLNTRKRGLLELPAPSVSDAELHKLAKLEQFHQQTATADVGGAMSATQALIGDYSDRPLPTPMRTPMTGGVGSGTNSHESLLTQATKLRALEQAQTPLLNAAMDDEQEDDHNYQDPVATPKLSMMDRKPSATPLSLTRDELGLNLQDDGSSIGPSTFASHSIRDMAREERRAAKRARKELEAALAALPAPQFEYDLSTPGDNDMQIETVPDDEEQDQADIDAAAQELRREEAEKLYEARSSVVKRPELPRPSGPIPTVEATSQAERVIQDERMVLMNHDAYAFPTIEVDKKSKHRKYVPTETPLDHLPENALDNATAMLQLELELLMQERIGAAMATGHFAHEHDAMDGLVVANIEASLFVPGETPDMSTLKAEFQALQAATAALVKQNDKTQAKISLKNGGYGKRVAAVKDTILEHFAALQNHRIEHAVFQHLQSHEVRGASNRIDGLREDIGRLEAYESVAQKRYGDLLLEKKRLLALMRAKQQSTKE